MAVLTRGAYIMANPALNNIMAMTSTQVFWEMRHAVSTRATRMRPSAVRMARWAASMTAAAAGDARASAAQTASAAAGSVGRNGIGLLPVIFVLRYVFGRSSDQS